MTATTTAVNIDAKTIVSFNDEGGFIAAPGDIENERLIILNQLYNDTSFEFLFQNYGPEINQDKRALSIGCGIGIYESKVAGCFKSIVGIDIVEGQINEANNFENKAENATFKVGDVYHLPKEEQFDVVMCRFVLSHLTNAELALDNMIAQCKPGGLIIIEEIAINEAFDASPQSNAYSRWVQLFKEQPKLQQSDFSFAYKIHELLRASKFEIIAQCTFKPYLITSEQKSILRLGLEVCYEKAKQFMDKDFLDRAIEHLKDFEKEDGYCAYVPMLQIAARKPVTEAAQEGWQKV